MCSNIGEFQILLNEQCENYGVKFLQSAAELELTMIYLPSMAVQGCICMTAILGAALKSPLYLSDCLNLLLYCHIVVQKAQPSHLQIDPLIIFPLGFYHNMAIPKPLNHYPYSI